MFKNIITNDGLTSKGYCITGLFICLALIIITLYKYYGTSERRSRSCRKYLLIPASKRNLDNTWIMFSSILKNITPYFKKYTCGFFTRTLLTDKEISPNDYIHCTMPMVIIHKKSLTCLHIVDGVGHFCTEAVDKQGITLRTKYKEDGFADTVAYSAVFFNRITKALTDIIEKRTYTPNDTVNNGYVNHIFVVINTLIPDESFYESIKNIDGLNNDRIFLAHNSVDVLNALKKIDDYDNQFNEYAFQKQDAVNLLNYFNERAITGDSRKFDNEAYISDGGRYLDMEMNKIKEKYIELPYYC